MISPEAARLAQQLLYYARLAIIAQEARGQ